MTRSIDDCVASSLDADPRLLPFLPELLADLEVLGPEFADVPAALEGAGLPRGARVLDLGCGKGAFSLALARHLGCRVEGIDGLPAFVEHARESARRAGLAELCRFTAGDARDAAAARRDLDAVLWLGTGDALGDLAATVRALRATVRTGGWIAVDESYALAPGADLPTLQECHRQLESAGDRVVHESLADLALLDRENRRASTAIERRARALAERQPDLAPLLEAYAANQWSETEAMASGLGCALWILRRGEDR